MFCSSCRKEMRPDSAASTVGIAFTIVPEKDAPPEVIADLRKQMGVYPINSTYLVCYECWLKSLGIKPENAQPIPDSDCFLFSSETDTEGVDIEEGDLP